jgi:hypothetical protein
MSTVLGVPVARARNLFFQQALDIAQQLVLIDAHQRQSFAGGRRATGNPAAFACWWRPISPPADWISKSCRTW